MISRMRHLAALAMGVALCASAQAQNLPSHDNSDYGPIHRANPNSMQGTQPNPPVIRGIQTGPSTPAPTLENGGIGNRYPLRETAPSRPATETTAPTVDANGNRRP